MSAGTCKHAASGCDYPASECSGKCALDAAPKQSAARHCECHIIGGLCSQCGARVGHNAAPINDGGAAFPMPGMSGLPNDGFIYGEPGMSLRDYFATRTLPACIAVASEAIAAGRITMSDEQAADFRRAICIDAWGWADEMLATRGKQS